jgi:hypothetical protein
MMVVVWMRMIVAECKGDEKRGDAGRPVGER